MQNLFDTQPKANELQFYLFERVEKLEWQKSYTVVFENGEIWETDNGHDALYICSIIDLMYPTDLQAKAMVKIDRSTKHFIDFYGDLLGVQVGIEQVESIGVWSFIQSKIQS